MKKDKTIKLYRTKFYTVNSNCNVDSLYYGKTQTEVEVGHEKVKTKKDCKFCKADRIFIRVQASYKAKVWDIPINRNPTIITYKQRAYNCTKCNKHWHYKSSLVHPRIKFVTQRLYDWVIYWMGEGASKKALMEISGLGRTQMEKVLDDYKEQLKTKGLENDNKEK